MSWGIVSWRGPLLAAALWASAVPAGLPARAADLTTPPAPVAPPSGWEFQATLYGWATSLTGDIGARDLPAIPVNVSFGDILGHLDGAVMADFLAKNGDWTLLADVFWSKLSADKTLGFAGPQLDFSQRLLVMQGIAGYRLPVGPDNFDLSATAGFRYQRLSVDTTLTPAGIPFGLSSSDVKDWLDPVFGLMLQYQFNDRWFLNAIGDVGGFGLGSKLTSQGFVAVGYNWNKSWSTAIGYRALYTDYESITGPRQNFRYNTTLHGPMFNIGYHF
ncbi:hypothetical protein [Xanthobacter pseudotagetidis]|uniref:hypothetical protein n=1 Tax=Xanthobacter pseudotagetidis TaxID=3119911 RepID=UPI003728F156